MAEPSAPGGDDPVELPADPAVAELAAAGVEGFDEVARTHPRSPLVWALLAEGCLLAGTFPSDLAAYGHATAGVRWGIEQLESAGWRPGRQVRWHDPSRAGVLRCLWAQSVAAGRLGMTRERDRTRAELEAMAPGAGGELAALVGIGVD